VVNPKLVLADEPTGNLDSTAAKEVIDLFIELNNSMGISFVIATHNSEIQSIASHGFEMRDGYLKQT
jgi:ABC-type lipoprotein export system ATPase subunit